MVITDYLDGRHERLSGLSDQQLADELGRKAGQAAEISRIVVKREEPGDGVLPGSTGNRHERRKQAAEARRRR